MPMPEIKYSTESSSGSAEIDRFPDTCPICERAGVFKPIFAYGKTDRYGESLRLQVVYRCPRQECQILFFAFYNDPYHVRPWTGTPTFYLQRFSLTEAVDPKVFEEPIPAISPKFPRIFNQAMIAEENGLDEICGTGYGKALEFLIKDYLIYIDPDSKDDIRKITKLGALIGRIKDGNIQIVAKRAAWLRNDESHYERVWKTKDVKNLKDLIELTVRHIATAEMTKQYEKEMPDEKESA